MKASGNKKLVKFLLQQLEDAWEKSEWHGFKRSLEGITEQEAAWQPPHYKHPWDFPGSITFIVFHVGGDDLCEINQAFGDRTLTWEALEAKFKASGGNLAAALKIAEEGHAAIQKTLEKMSDADLAQKLTIGKREWQADEFFMMLIEHHLYHAGQINYIRCMLDGLKAAEELKSKP